MKVKDQILLIGILSGLIILISNCSKKSEQVLFQEAQKALEENRVEETVKIYNQLIRTYPKSPNVPKAYFSLGVVYLGHLNDQSKAEEVWKKLLKKYPQFNLEKEFFDYAQKAQDEENPEFAIKLYDEILDFFPESPNREKAFFLKGFVYSEQLKDYTKAKEIYEKFIKDYPESELKDDAEFMLENLGKEPDWGKIK